MKEIEMEIRKKTFFQNGNDCAQYWFIIKLCYLLRRKLDKSLPLQTEPKSKK